MTTRVPNNDGSPPIRGKPATIYDVARRAKAQQGAHGASDICNTETGPRVAKEGLGRTARLAVSRAARPKKIDWATRVLYQPALTFMHEPKLGER